MSFLLALAAFAAILAVHSTAVTVIVQGLHKLGGFRSAGLHEMLRAFYNQNLSGLDVSSHLTTENHPDDEKKKTEVLTASSFADKLTKRAPSEDLKFWYVRSWPIIGSFFSSRQKSLTTLQFIEGLAQTWEGKSLANQSPEGLRGSLTTLAYEYERLGEAQSAYFRSRANLLSVIAGIVVALFVNFDAIAVYKGLSTNSELSARLTVMAQTDFAQTDATEDANAKSFVNMRSIGMPTGRKMFPHCENYAHTEGENYIDERCGLPQQAEVNDAWSKSYVQYAAAQSSPPTGALDHAATWLQYRSGRIAAIGHNPQTFLLWFLGILIAGGLMGLGAPFWFTVFSRLSTITMPAAQATLSQAASAKQKAIVTAAAVESNDVRPTGSSNPEILERAYLTVLSKEKIIAGSNTKTGQGIGLLDEANPGKIIGRRPR